MTSMRQELLPASITRKNETEEVKYLLRPHSKWVWEPRFKHRPAGSSARILSTVFIRLSRFLGSLII